MQSAQMLMCGVWVGRELGLIACAGLYEYVLEIRRTRVMLPIVYFFDHGQCNRLRLWYNLLLLPHGRRCGLITWPACIHQTLCSIAGICQEVLGFAPDEMPSGDCNTWREEHHVCQVTRHCSLLTIDTLESIMNLTQFVSFCCSRFRAIASCRRRGVALLVATSSSRCAAKHAGNAVGYMYM